MHSAIILSSSASDMLIYVQTSFSL